MNKKILGLSIAGVVALASVAGVTAFAITEAKKQQNVNSDDYVKIKFDYASGSLTTAGVSGLSYETPVLKELVIKAGSNSTFTTGYVKTTITLASSSSQEIRMDVATTDFKLSTTTPAYTLSTYTGLEGAVTTCSLYSPITTESISYYFKFSLQDLGSKTAEEISAISGDFIVALSYSETNV